MSPLVPHSKVVKVLFLLYVFLLCFAIVTRSSLCPHLEQTQEHIEVDPDLIVCQIPHLAVVHIACMDDETLTAFLVEWTK